MEKNKEEKIEKVALKSESKDFESSAAQGLRKRFALVLALTLGTLFGGSCDGCNCNVRVGGKEIAGCSAVDTGSKGSRLAAEKELEKREREKKNKSLEY